MEGEQDFLLDFWRKHSCLGHVQNSFEAHVVNNVLLLLLCKLVLSAYFDQARSEVLYDSVELNGDRAPERQVARIHADLTSKQKHVVFKQVSLTVRADVGGCPLGDSLNVQILSLLQLDISGAVGAQADAPNILAEWLDTDPDRRLQPK